MYVWKFDEDKCVFREVPMAALNADPGGFYVTRRARFADELIVREGGAERLFPEEGGLTVAGVAFDRDDFIPSPDLPRLSDAEFADLLAEMRRDGLWAKKRLQETAEAKARAEAELPLPIWITKGDADEPARSSPPGWLERLKRKLRR